MPKQDHRTQKRNRSTVFLYYTVFMAVAIILVGCGQVGVGNPVISADDALIFGGPDDTDGDDTETDPASAAVTVTYNLNGGTGELPVDSTTYSPGDTVVVQAPTILYIDDVVDRDFVYWNTKADGTGDFYVPEDTDYETSFIVGSEDVTLYAIYLGHQGPSGGLIFYDDESIGAGDEFADGRFVETADTILTDIAWSNVTDDQVVGLDLAIGSGPGNTDQIIGQVDHDDSAAARCRNLGSDYFLPSPSELSETYDILVRNGIATTAGVFWTSYSTSGASAVVFDITTGSSPTGGDPGKDELFMVLPCRVY
ncbi:MAG: InlB B-repeat-containing protein [Spirochaeta sp.]|jgi:hypothetical protein|nr:InlB B-repeat-containing protein [Spirochaeta sp.]